MTQEEKQLLLKDLCAREPYHPRIQVFNQGYEGFQDGEFDTHLWLHHIDAFRFDRIEILPYLRPMSSMTEEENAILNNISNKDRGYEEDEDGWVRCDSIHTKWGVWPDGCAKLLDYLNSIHVDYRGLIPMGLALEAPEGMYKTE